MSVITKDLGIASAYGYAKSKGYTGTEEEFAELMASYADVAQQAEAAAQDAEDAKDEAVTAKTDAQTAKTAAQAAQSAAETASGTASAKASEAAQSAQSAAGSASAAQTSATAASGSAQTAQTAAQTAITKASEASSSASAASTAKTGAETARTGAQTAQAAAETAQANAEAAASSVSASAAQIEQNTEDIAGLKNDLSELSSAYSAFVVETETGNIASFTDGADDVPVKDLIVAIEPVQSGSGDPSPENVRPITGWTGANVTRTGKNLVDIQDYSNTSVQTIVSETTPEFANVRYKGNTQYTFSGNVVIDNARAFGLQVIYTNDTSEYLWLSRFGTVSNSVTTASGKTVSSIVFVYDQVQTVTSLKNVMLEESSTATAYEPYQGETYEVDWTTEAGTVYGGTLDVTTGVLTVDRASVDISTLDFSQSNPERHIYRTDSLRNIIEPPDINYDLADTICSSFWQKAYGPLSASDNGAFSVVPKADTSSSGRCVFIDHRYFTLEDFVSGNSGVQLVYELATPQTYQLTPEEVSTILGQNNIFADTGNVTVQYRADTKLYIDKVINA